MISLSVSLTALPASVLSYHTLQGLEVIPAVCILTVIVGTLAVMVVTDEYAARSCLVVRPHPTHYRSRA